MIIVQMGEEVPVNQPNEFLFKKKLQGELIKILGRIFKFGGGVC